MLEHREILKQIVDIAVCIGEGKGQLARAYFELAQLCEESGRQPESQDCKEKAEALRQELCPDGRHAPFERATFMELCLWMLW